MIAVLCAITSNVTVYNIVWVRSEIYLFVN